jgi:predicted transcriptional regulator
MSKKAMTVRLDSELAEQLDILSVVQQRPASEIIRDAISAFVIALQRTSDFQDELFSHIEGMKKMQSVGEQMEVVHQCPPSGTGVMPCCGKTPSEVPLIDRMTGFESMVTCNVQGQDGGQS